MMNLIPCHRIKSRSVTIQGKTFPLCSRCMAILLGYLAIPILLYFYIQIPLYVGILMNIPMVIDGWTQLKKYRESNNVLRIITGLLCGIGQSMIVVSGSYTLAAWLA